MPHTVNSRLVDTPLLRTLAITDKMHIPGGSYRRLTKNDSRYCGITGTLCGTNPTFLLLGS